MRFRIHQSPDEMMIKTTSSLAISSLPIACLLSGSSAFLFFFASDLAQAQQAASGAALPTASIAAGLRGESPVQANERQATGSAPEPVAPVEALEQAMLELPLFSARLLRELYAARDFRFAWNPVRAASMLDLAQGSVAHGLEPNDFNADAIRALLSEAVLDGSDDVAARWRADLILSDALLRYLHHLQYGKHNPKAINPDWTFVDSVDAAALQVEMREVLAAADLVTAANAILPKAPFYEQLKRGYGRYLALGERLQLEGGWTPIPGGPNLKIGMRDQRLRRIRDQLRLLDGYDVPATGDPDIYDKPLYDALRDFQGRSGLAQDGVIGPRTLAALNRPFDERLALIQANLERMRWLYHELPRDYLLVDIAAFELELVREHQPVWSTRAVVGTGENQTPMFRDAMEHLVFNPTWSVPSSIQKEMRGVPGDYKVIDRRTGRRVYPSNPTDHRRYRLVQQPGSRNALGRVKFMFPNGHAIYLHDTPSRHLFARGRRSYSHGCVRVQEPLDLAREVLAKQNWDKGAIKRVVDSGRTRYVNLDEHLSVLLYYLTARADEQGRVGFRHDVYGRDASLLAALETAPDADRIVFREAPELDSSDALLPSQAVSISIHEDGTESPATAEHDEGLQLDAAAPRATPEVAPAPELSEPPASGAQQSALDPWWGLSMSVQVASTAPGRAASQRLRSSLGPGESPSLNEADRDLSSHRRY